MNPHWLRLAAHILRLYADRQIARGCDDLDWPNWFPVDEREPLVRAMEHDNNPDPARVAEVEDSVKHYARGSYSPPAWWLAAFFAARLEAK